MKKNNRAARATRFLVQCFDVVWQTIFEVLRTTRACILCLYMKTIRANQAKVHSTYFVQRAQHGINAKHLILRKVQF